MENSLYTIKSIIKPDKNLKGSKLRIFIFEWEFDLITPLIHDFYYENLLEDFL